MGGISRFVLCVFRRVATRRAEGADGVGVQAYFTAMSDLHRTEIQGLMTTLRGQIKKATDDELEASQSTTFLFLSTTQATEEFLCRLFRIEGVSYSPSAVDATSRYRCS